MHFHTSKYESPTPTEVVTILLHRPFFMDSNGNGPSRARLLCERAANSILMLAKRYDELFGFRYPGMSITNMLYVAATIFLLMAADCDTFASTSVSYLIDALVSVSISQPFATICVDALRRLQVSCRASCYQTDLSTIGLES